MKIKKLLISGPSLPGNLIAIVVILQKVSYHFLVFEVSNESCRLEKLLDPLAALTDHQVIKNAMALNSFKKMNFAPFFRSIL